MRTTLERDATLGGKQSAEHVRQILKGMPRRDRDLLRALLEERDKASVCREFGMDRDYLRVLLLRAKDKFKDNWADLAPGKRSGEDAVGCKPLAANQSVGHIRSA